MIDPAVVESFFGELQKIAEEEAVDAGGIDTATRLGGVGVLGGAGLVASPTTRGRLLGYKRVYHGTDPEAAKAIREEGLRTSFGGSSTAAVDAALPDREDVADIAKGKVYVSGQKGHARQYVPKAMNIKRMRAEGLGPEDMIGLMEDPFSEKTQDMTRRSIKSYLKSFIPGTEESKALLRADLPYDMWQQKAEADPLVKRLAEQQADSFDEMAEAVGEGVGAKILRNQAAKARAGTKDVAAILGTDIDPKFIHGGAGRGRAILERMKSVPGYVAKNPKRFLKGLGALGAGTSLIGGGGMLLHRGLSNQQEAT